MNTSRARRVGAVLLGLAAAGLAGFGLLVVWGLAVEYRAGLEVAPMAVVLPTSVALVAAACWPGTSGPRVLAAGTLVAAVLTASSLAASWLGERQRDQQDVQASERFACNGTNSEITVDPRVDQVYAELPRPARIYGPVEGTRQGCTAAVSGDAGEVFDAWAVELRDLDGWEVVDDAPRRVVVQRADGVTITLLRRHPTLLRVEVVPPG